MGQYQIGFVLLSENVPEKNGAFAGTLLNCGYSFATLLLTIYYSLVSKESYYIFYACLTLNVVAFIGSFWLPESVKWLVSVNRFREASEALQYIAKFNGKEDFKVLSFKREEEEIIRKQSAVI